MVWWGKAIDALGEGDRRDEYDSGRSHGAGLVRHAYTQKSTMGRSLAAPSKANILLSTILQTAIDPNIYTASTILLDAPPPPSGKPSTRSRVV